MMRMRSLIRRLFIALLLASCAPDQAASAKALPQGWHRSEIVGLTLAAPGRFGLRTVKLPPEAEANLEEMQSYRVRTDSLEVAVTRGTYRPGVPIDAMGSARGAVDALRGHPGVTDVTYSHARTEVAGVPAVRTAWQSRYEGFHLQGEILTIVQGQVLWQVEVTGTAAPGTSEAAATVLESVRMARQAGSRRG